MTTYRRSKIVYFDSTELGHAVTLTGVRALLAAHGHAELVRDEMVFKNHVVEGRTAFFVTSERHFLPRRA